MKCDFPKKTDGATLKMDIDNMSLSKVYRAVDNAIHIVNFDGLILLNKL